MNRQLGGEAGGRRMLRRWLLAGVAALYVASVPWYRETDAAPATWFGLPDWVAVAVFCYVGAAILNAVAWWLREEPRE